MTMRASILLAVGLLAASCLGTEGLSTKERNLLLRGQSASQLLRAMEAPEAADAADTADTADAADAADAAGEKELRVSGDGVDHVSGAYKGAKTIQDGTTAARKEGRELCDEESKATEKWLSEGNAEDAGDAAARRKSKAALADAIKGRIGGLQKFLKRLKRIRARLYEHIDRVNGIYGAKYEENMNYMEGGVKCLHALSLILTTPVSPKLNPIKNFLKWEKPSADAAAAVAEVAKGAGEAGPDTEPPAETALLQFDENSPAMLRFRAAQAEEEQCCSSHNCPCQKGRLQAFELYDAALALNKKMSTNFEAERKVLAAFREGLKKMIDKREAKLKALTEQVEGIEASMAAPDSEKIQTLFKGMEQHLGVLKESCAVHQQNEAADVGEVQKMVDLIKEHHVGVESGVEKEAEKVKADEEAREEAAEPKASEGADATQGDDPLAEDTPTETLF